MSIILDVFDVEGELEEVALSERDMMRGGCFALAAFLHKKTGYPIFALSDERGDLHHAFVVDGSYALDARGQISLENVHMYKGVPAKGRTLVEVPLARIEEFTDGSFYISDEEVSNFCDQVPDLNDLLSDANQGLDS